MEKIKVAALAACGVFSAFFSKLGPLGPLILALFACNVIDWFTGSAASVAEGQGVNSDRGRRGIAKKVGYWVEVVICLVVDLLLMYALPELTIGSTVIDFTAPFVSVMVCAWLDLNEILSILENLGRMGVPMPDWLCKFITVLKDKVDDSAEETITK